MSLCQSSTCNNTEKNTTLPSHYEGNWCEESIDIVSNNLPILINRLFTCVLLSIVLFACQNMPEGDGNGRTRLEYRAN